MLLKTSDLMEASHDSLSSHLSHKDVLFYFKGWTFLITVPPTSHFIGIKRKLRSVAGLNSPSQKNKKKAAVKRSYSASLQIPERDILFAGENINMI